MPAVADYLTTPVGFTLGVLGFEALSVAGKSFVGFEPARRGCLACGERQRQNFRVRSERGIVERERVSRQLDDCHRVSFPASKRAAFPDVALTRGQISGRGVQCNGRDASKRHKIFGFATDEANKFEGWHNAHLLIIADEAKGIPQPIFESIERCAPVRFLLMSSPGGCNGFFYDAFNARRKFFRQHVVRAADCPHISQAWIDSQIEKYGESHPLIQSMIFGEFMTGDADGCAIPLVFVERNLASPPAFHDDGIVKAFCDFAAGGDENVLAVRRGNRISIAAAWREVDTMKAVGKFIQLFREQKLTADQISADEGGLGIVICDRLAESGWCVNRVNNNSAAAKPEAYSNTAAEIWFEGRVKIEKGEIILPNNPELVAQLTGRRGWPDSKGRLQLESKQDMRSRGLPSPDRADAVLGTIMPARGGGWDANTLKGVFIGESFSRLRPRPTFTPRFTQRISSQPCGDFESMLRERGIEATRILPNK